MASLACIAVVAGSVAARVHRSWQPASSTSILAVPGSPVPLVLVNAATVCRDDCTIWDTLTLTKIDGLPTIVGSVDGLRPVVEYSGPFPWGYVDLIAIEPRFVAGTFRTKGPAVSWFVIARSNPARSVRFTDEESWLQQVAQFRQGS
jgi:hypothetical protein